MPNETATSNSSNCSAWQQSSSTNSNNNNTIDTPPDSAVLPVRQENWILILFQIFIAERLAKSC
jgi:hypothetical protein